MKDHIKNIFIRSAISQEFIGKQIAAHQSKTAIGGHSIFLGQVRQDVVGQKMVTAIEYSSYEEMALLQMHRIREDIIKKHSLTCMHVYHSIGKIGIGEICLFVFTSAPHRKESTDACSEIVERIKSELPIWGREIFEDETSQWKINQPL